MDDGNGRHNPYFKPASSPWNTVPPHLIKEQTNALVMNKKIMGILAERDSAIQERNAALCEKRAALAARDEALQQREKALAERDKALMERDNALAAIQYQENTINFPSYNGNPGPKRIPHPIYTSNELTETVKNTEDTNITSAFPINTIPPESTSKKTGSRKVNKVGEDLNKAGKKIRTDWDIQDAGLNLVNFDESTMPVPVCSCTGVPHQCYKWGNGGWQSSCCTTTMSCYPLPQMPNKRHARVGGRKMSGSVFTKLLSRLAAEGHDLRLPLDLKDYWARHGTNRYITIK